jgi:hypothetical protein
MLRTILACISDDLDEVPSESNPYWQEVSDSEWRVAPPAHTQALACALDDLSNALPDIDNNAD